MDATMMAEMKKMLEEKKSHIEGELSRFAKPTAEGNYETTMQDMGSDRDENASEVEEYVDNRALETTLENELHEIVAALARMESGSYGVCESCGKEIDPERLKAYASARTCVECVAGE